METDYSARYEQLTSQMLALSGEIPGPMGGFHSMHRSALADGALTHRTKELMALAIGIVLRGESCITVHLHDALQAGATREEVLETIGVAILMGGGPSVTAAALTLDALAQMDRNLTDKEPRPYGP